METAKNTETLERVNTLASLEKKVKDFGPAFLAELNRSLPDGGKVARDQIREETQKLITTAEALVAELKVRETKSGLKDLLALTDTLVDAYYRVSMDNAAKWRIIMGWDCVAGQA